jgi:hypothetical protein
MQEAKAGKPQTIDWTSEVDLTGARFGYLIDHAGQYAITIGQNLNGDGFQGIVKRMVRMRNGDVRVTLNGGAKVFHLLFTPPYRATVKEPEPAKDEVKK